MACARFLKIVVFSVVVVFACSSSFVCAQAESVVPLVRIGVLAKRGDAKALERWSATASYLTSKNPAYQFKIIPLGFDQIYPVVEHGMVDFILVNSAYYVALERTYGVEAIATMENRRGDAVFSQFGGVIFCKASRKDLQGYQDFRDKSFMAVDENSFGGYHMAWFHLLQHGLDPQKEFRSLTFAGTHDGVVNAVLQGAVDLGTVRTDTLERMAAEGKINLEDFKVFHAEENARLHFPFLVTTDLYPEWPMARLSHVSENLAISVARSLMLMTVADQAASAAMINGWTAPYSYVPVHECLLGLRVPPYADLDNISLHEAFRRYRLVIFVFVFVLGIVSVFSFFLSRAKKELEQELRHKKETEKNLSQFKTTLDQVYDCVFMFDVESLLFFYVNQGAMNQVGYTGDELMTMTPLDIMLEYSEETFREMLQPLQEGETGLLSFETGHWHKAGYLIPVDVHLQYVSSPETDDRFVAVVRDVTAQKEDEKQFRRLFESSMDATMITNEQGFVDCNRRTLEMFGYENKKDFLQLHPGDVSPPTQPCGSSSFELACEKIKEAIENKVAFFDWVHQRQNGSLFPAEVMLSPFEMSGQTVLHAVVRDVSERKKAEKEQGKLQAKLLHAQKLESVGQLASGIAHEINTPTQYVANNISFLAEVIEDVQEIIDEFIYILALGRKHGTITPERLEQAAALLEELGWDELQKEIPDAIKQSQEGLRRVTSIVQAMKEFSHPGSREKADTDINQVITTTLTVARNEWKYVAEVDAKLSEDLPLIPCLADEIGQVILNMIVNAAHAIAEKLGENSEEKGRIFIQTSYDTESVEIMITDTGNGIPEDILPRIFDPFFTTKKVGKGSGQGLAISHDVITEKHSGSLTCDSRVGVGTTFIIRLPRDKS